jgi:hypothetical protein
MLSLLFPCNFSSVSAKPDGLSPDLRLEHIRLVEQQDDRRPSEKSAVLPHRQSGQNETLTQPRVTSAFGRTKRTSTAGASMSANDRGCVKKRWKLLLARNNGIEDVVSAIICCA